MILIVLHRVRDVMVLKPKTLHRVNDVRFLTYFSGLTTESRLRLGAIDRIAKQLI